MRRFWGAFLVALAALGIAPAWAQRTVTMDENSGGSVRLRVGDTLKIRLRADAGPNYRWSVAENNSALLSHRDDVSMNDGMAIQRFTAIGAGGERLSLLYQDPSKRGVRALDTFRILVIIEGGRGGKTVTVRREDNNRPVTLTLGDTLDVRLPVNAGTGYSWGVGFNDGVLLRQSRTATFRPTSGLMGGPGGQSFRFKTVGLGAGALILNLRAPGGRQIADTFTLPVSVVPPLSPTPKNVVTLTDADNKSAITLNVGDTLVVRLNSNPTTGYDWSLTDNPPPTLQLLGSPSYERPQTGMIGAGGVRVYRFKVVSSGGGILRFLYQRSWEKNLQAARKWEVTFEVPRMGG